MIPEILIVGDPALRRDLIAKVRDCGYDVTLCLPKQIEQRLAEPPIPAAVIVCMEDVQAPLLLATLRRGRVGAMLPVILYVSTEHANQGLADVIDLGADHVIEDPIDSDLLRRALIELAGNPLTSPNVANTKDSGSEWGGEVETESQRKNQLHTPDNKFDSSHREHEIGNLPISRKRYAQMASEDSDAWEVEAMGLDSIPDVEPEGDPIDADESHSRLRLDSNPIGSNLRDAASRESSSQHGSPHLGADEENTEHRVWQPPTLDRNFDAEELHSDSSDTESRFSKGRGPDLSKGSSPAVRSHELDRSRNRYDTRSTHSEQKGYSPIEATQPIEHLQIANNEADFRGKVQVANSATTPSASKTMSGKVGTIEITRVYWRLAQSRFSGILKVESEEGLRTLEWTLGEIYSASSSVLQDSIENQLLGSGVLTREQLSHAQISPGTEPDVVLGELMRNGLIKASESGLLFGDYVLNIAYQVLAQCDGNWEQVEYAAPKSRRKASGFEVDLVIFHGVRLQLELNEIRSRLANYSITPRRRTGGQASHEELARWSERYELSREEIRWIRNFDGTRNLEQLLSQGGDRHQLWTLIYSLHVMDRIELPEAVPEDTVNPVAIDGERILYRLRLAREADYFEFLGIDLDASQSEIRSAYARLSKTFSDEQLEQQSRELYASQLKELRLALREAHDILLDEVLRQAYAAHIGER